MLNLFFTLSASFLTAVVGGAFTGYVTIIIMRKDVDYNSRDISKHDKDIDNLYKFNHDNAERISNLEGRINGGLK